MTPTEEARFIALWQQGLSHEGLAQRLGIPEGAVKSRAHRLQARGLISPRPRGGRHPSTRESTAAHSGTPAVRQRHTAVRSGTPDEQYTGVHPGTPAQPTPVHYGVPVVQSTMAHSGTPAEPSTPAHPGVPLSNDLAVRLLSLLPELEVMVARERDRQRLWSTPIGTPRHTVKKTYVVDTLYVDLIERYAQAEGVERKDVVNLAFHKFFERRPYLPVEE